MFARLLTLHSDDSWLKYQQYVDNVKLWKNILSDYNWKWLFQKTDKIIFEEILNVLKVKINYREVVKIMMVQCKKGLEFVTQGSKLR